MQYPMARTRIHVLFSFRFKYKLADWQSLGLVLRRHYTDVTPYQSPMEGYFRIGTTGSNQIAKTWRLQ